MCLHDRGESQTLVTDQEGRCSALVHGWSAVVFVEHEGYARSTRDVALEGREIAVELRLEPEAIVEGQVVDASGAPVRDASVTASMGPMGASP
jgi:protocatechuate 3,4-dioxygenase beta subunit